jgi:hypothetical protein
MRLDLTIRVNSYINFLPEINKTSTPMKMKDFELIFNITPPSSYMDEPPNSHGRTLTG